MSYFLPQIVWVWRWILWTTTGLMQVFFFVCFFFACLFVIFHRLYQHHITRFYIRLFKSAKLKRLLPLPSVKLTCTALIKIYGLRRNAGGGGWARRLIPVRIRPMCFLQLRLESGETSSRALMCSSGETLSVCLKAASRNITSPLLLSHQRTWISKGVSYCP